MRRVACIALAACTLVLSGALSACAQEVYAPPTPPRPPALAPPSAPDMAPSLAPTFFPDHCAVQPPREYAALFVGASQRHRVGACDLARQTNAESHFDPEARSPAGAIGISQFLPATAKEWGIDPLDPEQAIYGQARYVRWCRDRWDPDLPGRTGDDIKRLGLGVYNFGVGNMYANQRQWGWVLYRDAEPYLPSETRNYVRRIMD